MDCSVCNFNGPKCSVQFKQIQTPEDGHIGPKHVVLSESEGRKKLLHYRGD
jgi:hypothetical protein